MALQKPKRRLAQRQPKKKEMLAITASNRTEVAALLKSAAEKAQYTRRPSIQVARITVRQGPRWAAKPKGGGPTQVNATPTGRETLPEEPLGERLPTGRFRRHGRIGSLV
jgi:hypothetical protein